MTTGRINQVSIVTTASMCKITEKFSSKSFDRSTRRDQKKREAKFLNRSTRRDQDKLSSLFRDAELAQAAVVSSVLSEQVKQKSLTLTSSILK